MNRLPSFHDDGLVLCEDMNLTAPYSINTNTDTRDDLDFPHC
jgi:hypothetical protein